MNMLSDVIPGQGSLSHQSNKLAIEGILKLYSGRETICYLPCGWTRPVEVGCYARWGTTV